MTSRESIHTEKKKKTHVHRRENSCFSFFFFPSCRQEQSGRRIRRYLHLNKIVVDYTS